MKYFAQWKLIWFYIKIGWRKKNLPSHCGVISTNCFYSNQIKYCINQGYKCFINFTKFLLPHPFGLIEWYCDVIVLWRHTVWVSHCLNVTLSGSTSTKITLHDFGFKILDLNKKIPWRWVFILSDLLIWSIWHLCGVYWTPRRAVWSLSVVKFTPKGRTIRFLVGGVEENGKKIPCLGHSGKKNSLPGSIRKKKFPARVHQKKKIPCPWVRLLTLVWVKFKANQVSYSWNFISKLLNSKMFCLQLRAATMEPTHSLVS